jgi:hypothetical protein
MFWASLCPSSGEQNCVLLHMVFCTGCAGCSCVEHPGTEHVVCTARKLLFYFHTVHTARVRAPHKHSQHNQCRTPYAVVHNLDLLMMGTMMPKTCWDRSLIINIRLVASCWFLSLRLTFMMHGHKSPKFAFLFFGSLTVMEDRSQPEIIIKLFASLIHSRHSDLIRVQHLLLLITRFNQETVKYCQLIKQS